jgi:hypothetical protein
VGIVFHPWDETDAATQQAQGNSPTTISGQVSWEGLAAGWQVGPQGELMVRKRVELDDQPNHALGFDIMTVAPGAWEVIEAEGYAVDFEAMKAAEEAAQAAQAQNDAAAQLGIVPSQPLGPAKANRVQRRQPAPR